MPPSCVILNFFSGPEIYVLNSISGQIMRKETVKHKMFEYKHNSCLDATPAS